MQFFFGPLCRSIETYWSLTWDNLHTSVSNNVCSMHVGICIRSCCSVTAPIASLRISVQQFPLLVMVIHRTGHGSRYRCHNGSRVSKYDPSDPVPALTEAIPTTHFAIPFQTVSEANDICKAAAEYRIGGDLSRGVREPCAGHQRPNVCTR